jgi:proteasome lid subunit RPN8/RPN11
MIAWTLHEQPFEAAGYLFANNTIFRKIITGDHSIAHFTEQKPEKLLQWIMKYGKPTAIFHSHPCKAVPSQTDIRFMSTTIPIFDCVWLIMSNELKLRAWTIGGVKEVNGHKAMPRRGQTIYPKEIEVEIVEEITK